MTGEGLDSGTNEKLEITNFAENDCIHSKISDFVGNNFLVALSLKSSLKSLLVASS